MHLPVKFIDSRYIWFVNLPRCFLNGLLEDGFNFDDGMLSLLLITPFGNSFAVCMNEFVYDTETIDIPRELNEYLNVTDGTYINVEVVTPPTPSKVLLQGCNKTFAFIDDIKEKLETLFVGLRIINKDMNLEIDGEPFTIVAIYIESSGGETAVEIEASYALTVDADIEVTFLETKEDILEKKLEEERLEKERLEKEQLEAQRLADQDKKKLGGDDTKSKLLDLTQDKHKHIRGQLEILRRTNRGLCRLVTGLLDIIPVTDIVIRDSQHITIESGETLQVNIDHEKGRALVSGSRSAALMNYLEHCPGLVIAKN